MRTLQTAMDRDRFDVPIRSEGFYGPNWHELTKIHLKDEYPDYKGADIRKAPEGKISVNLNYLSDTPSHGRAVTTFKDN
jgi:hypothetical protein